MKSYDPNQFAGFSETERQERPRGQHAERRHWQFAGPTIQAVAVLLIAGALNFGYWYQLDREKKSIAVETRLAKTEESRIGRHQVRYLERQKQAEAYKRRVDVIDQLRSNQTGPVGLLSMIGDTVNGTEAVWLNSMSDQGGSVAIDGTALSSDGALPGSRRDFVLTLSGS